MYKYFFQFPLQPDYQYKLRVIAYHESSGEWRTWLKIDNVLQHLIKYNAYIPEALEFWIPPAFYQDSVIEVTFDRVTGNFASIGPIFIYQYEYEEGGGNGGGPMAQGSQPTHNAVVTVFPNPFREKLNITSQTVGQNRVDIKLYDVAGRLVKQFNHLTIRPSYQFSWYGEDETGRSVAQGVYFIRIDYLDTGYSSVHKVLKIR